MKYFVIFLCIIGYSASRKLPDYITPCRKSEDLGKCITSNIENVVKPRLDNGIPELGMPSINPLLIPKAELATNNFNATFENLKVWDVKSFKIEHLKVVLSDTSVDLQLLLPHIRVDFDYQVFGKILVLTLDGKGQGQLNLTNIEAAVTFDGTQENRNGKTYIVQGKMNISPKIGKLSIRLDDLIKNNPEITENANKLLNENQDLLIEEFSPVIVEMVNKFMSSTLKNVFDNFSVDELFPEK